MADSRRNPRNNETQLFKRLTRLLSGPIVNRRTQLYRKEKRRRMDKYKFKSASGKNFKKSTYSPFEQIQANAMANQNRSDRYIDFDQMEYSPEIASAMDIYADEMTTYTSLQEMLKIDSSNEEIKQILNNLYFEVLNVEFNLFGWARTMCKYGDFFLYLDIEEGEGVRNVIGLPSHEVERLEGEDKTNPNYVQFQWNSGGLTFENWQIAHFRILGNDKYAPYGTSVLEASRRIWRQLTLLEDAMMAYRIVRSPERRVFYVDIGAIAPEDVEQYMQKVVTTMKRNQVIEETTGRVDLRYNPMSIEEDYFIPVRGQNSPSKVESLPGGTYTGDIDDVKYLRDKLFSALKIPASYLSRSDGGDEDKATLAQKDIRFARTIQRLQRSIISELEKIGLIHLYTLGYRGKDLNSHKLFLNNPSKIAELQELEHWRTKFDVAAAANENYFSQRWVATKIFGFTDEEFLRNQREMFFDRRFQASLEKESEAFVVESGGLGDEISGLDGIDLGDEEGIDLDNEGGEDIPEEPSGEVELDGEADDETLLSAPGKRDDNLTTTPRSKGKMYEPVKHRGGDRRRAGARKRSNLAKGAREKGSATKRNIFGGAADLFTLGNGIYEKYERAYRGVMEEELTPTATTTEQTEEKSSENLSSDERQLLRIEEELDSVLKEIKENSKTEEIIESLKGKKGNGKKKI